MAFLMPSPIAPKAPSMKPLTAPVNLSHRLRPRLAASSISFSPSLRASSEAFCTTSPMPVRSARATISSWNSDKPFSTPESFSLPSMLFSSAESAQSFILPSRASFTPESWLWWAM
ncbi:hypothetical protein D3C72_601470 [compost metagenome]